VREALAQTFDEFDASMGEEALAFMWSNGKAAKPMAKAKSLRAAAAGLGSDDRFDFDFMAGSAPALRPIRASEIDSLQRGTVNGDAPVYNNKASTTAWLRRFEMNEDGLLAAKAALLDSTPLVAENALPNPL
jgi:hypothetical protein